jgi:ligand-binding sensor domain-containing protein
MKQLGWKLFYLVLLALAFVVPGCATGTKNSTTHSPAATASPVTETRHPGSPTPKEPPIPADSLSATPIVETSSIEIRCAWDGVVRAWLDQNENGKWEHDEPPLPGVRFLLHWEGFNQPFEPTDWNGETYFYPHCVSGQEIIARIPPGYHLTTAGRLPIYTGYSNIKSFGFAQSAGLPTATPRPPDPQCRSLPVPAGNDLLVAPDGALWVATRNGAIRFDPVTESWINYTTENGLASNHVNAIAASADGSLWFGTDLGVTHYDGSSWRSYTQDDGLTGGEVLSLAAVDNGIIWAGTENSGISRFDPETAHWTPHYSRDHGLVGPVFQIITSPDHSLWFTDQDSLSQLSAPSAPVENLSWQTFSTPFNIDTLSYEGATIAVTAEGTAWVIGITQVARLTVQSGEWDVYTPPIEIPYLSLASAGGADIWLGTYDALVYFQPERGINNPHAWRIYADQTGVDGNFIIQIIPGEDGIVWLGTLDGLVRCHFEQ